MRIIALPPLVNFWTSHADAEGPLKAWIAHVKQATWHSPAEVKQDFASASLIAGSRVVFNIKGNDYRLIVAILYAPQVVMIKFIGTHAAYDRVEAATVEIEGR